MENVGILNLHRLHDLSFNSASSGGGGGRGAPQHYPKTASNRYVSLLFELSFSKGRG